MTAPEVHEALAEVLAAHGGTKQERTVPRPGISEWHRTCLCGEKLPWGIQAAETAHRLHLARVLADHFAEAVTEARADGETEWGVRYQNLYDESVYIARGGEASARAALVDGDVLVRRTVTPWVRADSLAPEAPSEVQR